MAEPSDQEIKSIAIMVNQGLGVKPYACRIQDNVTAFAKARLEIITAQLWSYLSLPSKVHLMRDVLDRECYMLI